MRHIKNFKLFELTENEFNRILDKINKSGRGSLSKEENDKLNNFNGDYDREESSVSFDKDGNILVDGKPPLYNKVEEDPKKRKGIPKNEPAPKQLKSGRLVDVLDLKKSQNSLFLLHDGPKSVVFLDAKMVNNRIYFINFKEIKDDKSRACVIKMEYSMNSRRYQNFKIYDNYSNELEFNKLDMFLKANGLEYSEFNNAWYYIEENFNNAGYI